MGWKCLLIFFFRRILVYLGWREKEIFKKYFYRIALLRGINEGAFGEKDDKFSRIIDDEHGKRSVKKKAER